MSVTLEEAMSDEELKKALGLLLGWSRHRIEKSSDGVAIYETVWLPKDHKPPLTNDEIQEHCRISLPDYPHDLNAVQSIILNLEPLQRAKVQYELGKMAIKQGICFVECLPRLWCEALVLCLSARETNTSGSGVSNPKPVGAAARKEGQ